MNVQNLLDLLNSIPENERAITPVILKGYNVEQYTGYRLVKSTLEAETGNPLGSNMPCIVLKTG